MEADLVVRGGTVVDGERLERPSFLADGNTVVLGPVSLRFEDPQARVRAPYLADPTRERVPVPVFWQSARLPVGQQAWPFQASVRLSSGVPLQSSSRPLQTSTLGPVEPTQRRLPVRQAVVPA